MKLNNVNESLLIILCWLICILFGFFIANKQITDPFLYFDVAFIKEISNSLFLNIPAHGPFSSLDIAPGRIMLMLIISKVANLNPVNLQFFPIGYSIIPIILYYVLKKLLNSTIISIFLTFYFVFNPSQLVGFYSIFAYAFAFPLYLCYVVVYLNMYENKTNYTNILLLMVLFISTNYIHYTMTFWMIMFSLCINLYIILFNKYGGQISKKHISYNLLLSFIVFFLYFNKIIYKSYIPHMKESIQTTSIYFFSKVPLLSDTLVTEYQYVRSFEVNFVSFLNLFLIILFVILGFLFIDFKKITSDNSIFSKNLLIRFCLFFTGVLDMIFYALRGNISTKYITLMFPIIIFSYVVEDSKKYLKILFIIFLSILLVKLFLFINLDYIGSPSLSYNQLNPSTNWLISNSPVNSVISTDLGIYGVLIVNSNNSIKHQYVPYDLEKYKYVIGQASSGYRFDYLVLDMNSNNPVYSYYWALFKSFSHYRVKIDANSNLNKIYVDKDIWVMHHR